MTRGLWLLSFAIPAVLLLLGKISQIPYGEYAAAGRRWNEHLPLYDLSNIDGFQYLPTSALLFAPLAWLGSPLGDLLWRALGWTCYAWGLWRVCCSLRPPDRQLTFFFASALAIGPAVTNLINGQANLLIAALVLHTGVDLVERRWWRASVLLSFGLALKPLMAVPLLLVAALYPGVRWRVLIALPIALASPWLFRDRSYVLAQYTDAIKKLQLCAQPDRLFEDVRGLLVSLGLDCSEGTYLGLRIAAAASVLALGWRARQLRDDASSSLIVCALSVSYLMLFNPRTLSSSYVMPGAYAAALAALYLGQRRFAGAAVLVGVCLAWSVNHHVVPWIEYWLRPAATLVFFALLAQRPLASAVPVQTTLQT